MDTLRKLRECYPQDELYLLMGTDMFLSFFQWREPEAIAALAVPVCMARVRADAALSAQLLAQQEKMEAVFGVRPIVLQNDCLEISSTEARRLLFFGIADEVLHPDVLAMIERERLYGVGGAYHALPFADLRRVSLSLHKEKRRAHAQGVSDTAVLLAKKYGADETDAARAGILHDITKALSPAQQQKLVDHWKLPVSPFEYAQTKLLHAKTSLTILMHLRSKRYKYFLNLVTKHLNVFFGIGITIHAAVSHINKILKAKHLCLFGAVLYQLIINFIKLFLIIFKEAGISSPCFLTGITI